SSDLTKKPRRSIGRDWKTGGDRATRVAARMPVRWAGAGIKQGTRRGLRMRICRFGDDRLGLVEGDDVIDVSAALEALPAVRWPYPPGDAVIANWPLSEPRV